MAELRKGLAQRRSVPQGGEPTAGLTYLVNPGTTAGIYAPSSEMQDRMALEGVRYGDPDLPRHATGRVDGKAPKLSTAADFTMRTKRAGGVKAGSNPHPSAKGLDQPERRKVW